MNITSITACRPPKVLNPWRDILKMFSSAASAIACVMLAVIATLICQAALH